MRTEDGIVIGNLTDKSSPPGRLARRLVERFDAALLRAARGAAPTKIHEVGCGEGRICRMLRKELGVPVQGTDFSLTLISENLDRGDAGIRYEQCSIYDLNREAHGADLVVCCEVLEHLEEPDRGLQALARLEARQVILSVPREPLWRFLNCCRGKYLRSLGNTPGHLNHWSERRFHRFLRRHHFQPDEWINPLPWLMVRGRFLKA
ncbi:MAG: class I SAM-dependent methyltransferase [Puniceicoccaceae bacterium]|nr:MAG: class I SAM-dependent methyltransferase [Puniceicoccaceae bacterium]